MTQAAHFPDLVARRASCRSYDAGREVPVAMLEQCIEAARLAPSACNRQPWRFVVVNDAAKLAAIHGGCRLPGIPHEWLAAAPVIVALCVDLDFVTHRLAPAVSGIPYYLIDAGIAGEHFVLAAAEQGLGTCWIGWFRPRRVRKILHIPHSVRVVSLISVGYPVPDWQPPPKKRRATDEIAFWNGWGEW